ncbi:MAG: cyclase family protein [Actinomycetota bacterium]|nr:cyclase family protein [Actinomycetota bacterium]
MLVELSHPIEDGMPAYPGLPAARIEPILDHDESRERYENRAEFHLGRVEIAGNTGTYVDAPFHRWREREDLARVPLERLADLAGLVEDAPALSGAVRITADPKAMRGKALLIRTGWDARWRTDAYWEPGPFLDGESIDLLLETGVVLVGVDFANVDDTTDPSRPAHTRLLEAGIPLVEHLTGLGQLPATGFRFFATPPRIVRGASFPVRAFAIVD